MSETKTPLPSSHIDELSQQVYNELVRSVCIEVAYGVHKMTKMGIIKFSDTMIPNSGDLPSSTSSDTLMEELVKSGKNAHFATRTDGLPPPKRRCRALSLQNSPVSMVTRNNSVSNSQFDIWGRIVPKEPKKSVKCIHCGKSLSALRFAMHLDRCLVGNSRTTK